MIPDGLLTLAIIFALGFVLGWGCAPFLSPDEHERKGRR